MIDKSKLAALAAMLLAVGAGCASEKGSKQGGACAQPFWPPPKENRRQDADTDLCYADAAKYAAVEEQWVGKELVWRAFHVSPDALASQPALQELVVGMAAKYLNGGDIVDTEVVVEGGKIYYEVTTEKDGVRHEALCRKKAGAPETSAAALAPDWYEPLAFEEHIPPTHPDFEKAVAIADAALPQYSVAAIDVAERAFVERIYGPAPEAAAPPVAASEPPPPFELPHGFICGGFHVKRLTTDGTRYKVVLVAGASSWDVKAIFVEKSDGNLETETMVGP